MNEELLQQYIDSLGNRLQRIESLLEKLASGNSKAEENIRLLAHSLAGSGGSFGFPEISEAGKATELADKDDLEANLKTLGQVIEKVIADNGGGESEQKAEKKAPQKEPEQKAEVASEQTAEKTEPGQKKTKEKERSVLKILVVDDDPEISELVVNTLKDLPKKQDITTVGTAKKAQELFITESYDLIIMDLVLPDRDGRELIKEIKIEFRLTTPILVISGITNDSVRVECMSAGADKFLMKPFYEEDLLHESKKLLGKKAAKKLSLVPLDGEAVDEEDEEDEDKPKVLEGYQILLAEDDKMQARLIEQRLILEGATINHAANGREAMQFLRTRNYSLVLLDVNMPIMDGFEVLTRIKDELKLEIPVIMVTALGSEEDIIKGYDLGAIDYILKPFSEAQLVARIKSLLKPKIAS